MVEMKTLLFFKNFILGLKVVSMAKHIVEDVAQTIRFEVKAVHLNASNSCTEHNSQLNHSMEPVRPV